ncbi:Nn.00g080730.m01.CDS01 [Neocucurbitaria sp. VM-36]
MKGMPNANRQSQTASSGRRPTSPFFRLPRELRDYIYAYALYEPEGLFFQRQEDYKASFTSQQYETKEQNQLKYVCHQIRSEILGVEWQLNELIFSTDDAPCGHYMSKVPAVQFLGFLDMCSEVWRKRLRRVRLHCPGLSLYSCEDNPQHIQNLHVVAQICENYPQLTVLWHNGLCAKSDLGVSLLVDGLMFATAVRPDFPMAKYLRELQLSPIWCMTVIYHNLWRADPISDRITCACWGGTCGKRIQAKNFRIVPFVETFDESTFRKAMGEGRRDREENDMIFERRVALAKEWSVNGF